MRRQMLKILEDREHWIASSRVLQPGGEVRHLLATCGPTRPFIFDLSWASPTGCDRDNASHLATWEINEVHGLTDGIAVSTDASAKNILKIILAIWESNTSNTTRFSNSSGVQQLVRVSLLCRSTTRLWFRLNWGLPCSPWFRLMILTLLKQGKNEGQPHDAYFADIDAGWWYI